LVKPETNLELKGINRLAIPAILTGIAEPVISLVDTAFVGQIGTTELAAVGIAGSFYLATRYANGYGNTYIAAHTIALNIWLFASFFIDGYAHAGNAMAGRFLRQGNAAGIYALGR